MALKLPKQITLNIRDEEISLDIFDAIEYLYSIGYSDRMVASLLGYSKSRWSEILNNKKVVGVSQKVLKAIQRARERGIVKHQQRIINKLESIITNEKFNDPEFLLKYLKVRYPDDFITSEDARILIEFVEVKKNEGK